MLNGSFFNVNRWGRVFNSFTSGLLDKTKVGRSNFYINSPLMALFLERA